MKQILKKNEKKKVYKILLGVLVLFFGINSPIFAEVITTYSTTNTPFQYRSSYTGNDYLFSEPLNSVDGEIQGIAWKNYTLPAIEVNSSSIGFLKMKAIDIFLNYSYITDNNSNTFDVCGSTDTYGYYNFYSLPETFPNDNELGDSVYTFNQGDYVFTLAPTPRRHLAQTTITDNNSLSSSGTCPYTLTVNGGGNIPQGNYFAVAFNYTNETGGYLVDWVNPASSDREMTGDNYDTRPYTLAGYGYYPLTSGLAMALGSNTQDTDIVGCNAGVCDYYKQDFSVNGLIQPDFYITTDITAPPSEILSCNPFSDSISTAFLNLDFSFSACVQELAAFLFIPSDDATGQFSSLIETIKQKPPFGWIVETFDSLESIDPATATATFTLEQVTPITTAIFDPIRTGLSWLLYFIFAFYLFNRFKDIII